MLQAQFNFVTNNGTITITEYTGAGWNVVIPSEINGFPVTTIGTGAFFWASIQSITLPYGVSSIESGAFNRCSLRSITISDSVTNIGGGAFYLSKLATITIPDSVISIGGGAFKDCISLTNVTIGNGVTSIEERMFSGCTSLTSITIPNSVTTIGDYAFGDCSVLTSVRIPNSVTNIGDYAFIRCISLTNVTIGRSVNGIGQSAFDDCTRLTVIEVDTLNSVYSSLDGVLFNNSQTTLIECPKGKGGSYIIPDTVTSIGYRAFYGCTSLTSITIPNSVTSIGDQAFVYCTSLTSVTIPNSVTRIGDLAFAGCGSLTSVTIPNSVISIGVYAFNGCSGLISVAIGNSVTSIGDSAFSGLTSLTSITIPDSVTTIGDYAFGDCTSLTNVTIGNGVTSIGWVAFRDCTSLITVTIGNKVTSIGGRAFYGCTSLTGVYFQGNAPSLGADAFEDTENAIVYFLPGTTGWEATLGGRPTAPWYLPFPTILNLGSSFGVQTNGFGFIISWATNASLAVEACTSLGSSIWTPVGITTLTNGWSYFSDPQWTNHSDRYYRAVEVEVPTNVVPITNMVFIPPGTFLMGSPADEPVRDSDETQHEVTISRGFWMGKYEVTQEEYALVIGSNPSIFRNGMQPYSGIGGPVTNELRHPVEMVSWDDATNYCALLTQRERLAGRLPGGYAYRLPTEAEWEYACRAGTTTAFHYGWELRSGMANFDGRLEYPPCAPDQDYCTNAAGIYLGRPTAVGSYAANGWGLYDMHGNVYEYCADWYGSYSTGPVTDPLGPTSSSHRVERGGCWFYTAGDCRSAERSRADTDFRSGLYGFRVVLAPLRP